MFMQDVARIYLLVLYSTAILKSTCEGYGHPYVYVFKVNISNYRSLLHKGDLYGILCENVMDQPCQLHCDFCPRQ